MDYFLYNKPVSEKNINDELIKSIILGKSIEERIEAEKKENDEYNYRVNEPKKRISNKSVRTKT
jgi:hypothetical protein